MKQEVIQKAEEKPKQQGPNLTGIPTQMKLDFEQRSGLSFDDVRVHYNSDKPRKIGALAYTQIPQVHIGPGQERHLRHELGHVVQQKTRTIRPTLKIHNIDINDDPDIEKDADSDSLSRYGGAILHKSHNNIIQCKISVAASLSLRSTEQVEFPSNCFKVESIKLADRSDTGLFKGKNKTQGDHTIADALVKKHQTVMTRGQPLPNVFAFYLSLLQEVLHTNEKFAPLRQDTIARRDISDANAQEAMDLLGLYYKQPDIPFSSYDHRKNLIDIVTKYNDAYAHSYIATQGTGTRGHAEKAGMNAVRTKLSKGMLDSSLITLIDYNSIAQYGSAPLAEFLTYKFMKMLSEMSGYKLDDWLIRQNSHYITNDNGNIQYLNTMSGAEISQLLTGGVPEFLEIRKVQSNFHQIAQLIYNINTTGNANIYNEYQNSLNEIVKLFDGCPYTNITSTIDNHIRGIQHEIEVCLVNLTNKQRQPLITGDSSQYDCTTKDRIHLTVLFSNMFSEVDQQIECVSLGIVNSWKSQIMQHAMDLRVLISKAIEKNSDNSATFSVKELISITGLDRHIILSTVNSYMKKGIFSVKKDRNGRTIERYVFSIPFAGN